MSSSRESRVPDRPESLASRIRRRYGDDVDPVVSLEGEAPPAPTSATNELLKRLSGRGPSTLRYTLEEEVARGGMGAILRVWDGDLRRHLAMKVVLGADAPEPEVHEEIDRRLLSRFLEEAQITGQLDHPGIVPVHELGIDAEGRVYFTMKLVRGRDLKAIFDLVHQGAEGWNETRALGVILKACEAMAYAHAKGVIHRDLKPANVMVGGFGEVYVMDWGLARVLGRRDGHDVRIAPEAAIDPSSVRTDRREDRGVASDSPIVTMDGDVVGTPAYMPPEQARGEVQKLSARSDVYSIGALLYHLLARHPPYSEPGGRRASNRTILARVLDGPPRRLREIRPEIPAELIAICEKAMSREPDERYTDTLAFSEDLRAYLEHRVVRAHKTGAWAEAAKWVERNRAFAASLAAGVLVLVGGIVLVAAKNVELSHANATIEEQLLSLGEKTKEAEASRGIAEARRQEAETEKAQAEKNAEETRLVAEFQSGILSSISVEGFGRSLLSELRADLGDELTRGGAGSAEADAALLRFDADVKPAHATNVARKVLATQVFAPAVERIETEYRERPLLAALLQTPLSLTLHKLGLYELGTRAARSAVDARRTALGPQDPETLESINNLALLLQSQGKLEEAEPLYRDALAGYKARFGEEDPRTLTVMDNLALLSYNRGRLGEAESLLRGALEGRRKALGTDHPDTLSSMNNLASVLQDEGKLAEAEPLYREALEGCRSRLGEKHPNTLSAIGNLASMLQAQGKLAEAEPLFREELAGKRSVLGDDHPQTLGSMNNLALLLQEEGRSEESEPLFREALAGQRSKLGEEHPDTLSTMTNLGLFLIRKGSYAEAEELCRAALSGSRKTLGEKHPQTLAAINALASLLERQGKLADAEVLFRELLTDCRTTLGEEHPHTLVTLGNLAHLLLSEEKLDESETLYRQALATFSRIRGESDVDRLKTEMGLALALRHQAKFAEAEGLLKHAVEHAPEDGGVRGDARTALRDLYRAWHASDPTGGHDRQAEELEQQTGK